jgi:hypothetical protein
MNMGRRSQNKFTKLYLVKANCFLSEVFAYRKEYLKQDVTNDFKNNIQDYLKKKIENTQCENGEINFFSFYKKVFAADVKKIDSLSLYYEINPVDLMLFKYAYEVKLRFERKKYYLEPILLITKALALMALKVLKGNAQ